jgi:hypothetical protein
MILQRLPRPPAAAPYRTRSDPRRWRRRHRPTAWLVASALSLPVAATAGEPAPAAEDPWSGTYQVQGLTVDQRTGDTRRIAGHVVLTRKNDHWLAAAELKTAFPSHGGAVSADVIGRGDGKLRDDVLVGTAQTQLVMQTVPGVDTNFGFIPRAVGPRLVSDWTARWERPGELAVEMTNRGEEGEDYSPTKTTLKGRRVTMPADASP